MSDSYTRGSPDRHSLHEINGRPMSSSNSRFTEDLTNAEAFQLFSCKLDAALAENKKSILKEFEAKTSATQGKENSVDFKLEHHKERIADKYGWDVAKEFKDDPITENSEESQRLRQAEARAKRKRFDKKGFSNPFRGDSKFVQPRYAPYPRFQFNSAGWNNGGSQSGPYRIQPDQCLYCNGFGHWSINCPLKKRSQAIGKPTSTQTSASGETQRT
nr:uncharacterized protein LOC117690277 isoform X2 [Crassostrea gigas]